VNYLLDTNICVAVLNNRPPGVQTRLQRMIETGHKPSASVITAFELWYGAYKSQLVERNLERLTIFFSALAIIPFEEGDSLLAGQLRAQLEKEGCVIGPFDLLIAAHALRHECTLVTNNFREFRRVPGLRVEDWIADAT
jgi:tRNA(fMet)-specific endonuclease VapC